MSAIVRTSKTSRQVLAELVQRLGAVLARPDRTDDASSTRFSWPRGL